MQLCATCEHNDNNTYSSVIRSMIFTIQQQAYSCVLYTTRTTIQQQVPTAVLSVSEHNNTAVGFYKHTFSKNPLDTMFFLELTIQQFAQQLCYWQLTIQNTAVGPTAVLSVSEYNNTAVGWSPLEPLFSVGSALFGTPTTPYSSGRLQLQL